MAIIHLKCLKLFLGSALFLPGFFRFPKKSLFKPPPGRGIWPEYLPLCIGFACEAKMGKFGHKKGRNLPKNQNFQNPLHHQLGSTKFQVTPIIPVRENVSLPKLIFRPFL